MPYLGKKFVIAKPEPAKCVAEACVSSAVGSSAFCKRHGGDTLIPENLIPDEVVRDLAPALQAAAAKKPYHVTIYDPDYHPSEAIRLAEEGLSSVAIAAAFRISEKTLEQWGDTYESFHEALGIARAIEKSWWQKKGQVNLENPRFNVPLYKHLSINLADMAEKSEVKTTSVVTHGVMLVPSPTNPSDWSSKVQQAIDVTPKQITNDERSDE